MLITPLCPDFIRMIVAKSRKCHASSYVITPPLSWNKLKQITSTYKLPTVLWNFSCNVTRLYSLLFVKIVSLSLIVMSKYEAEYLLF